MAEDTSPSGAGGSGPEIPKGRAKGRASGSSLSPAEKALRDAAIVASLHSGMTSREVGREFELTSRSIERIAAAFDQSRTPLEQPPMEIIERVLRSYESQLRRFALVAQDTLGRAPAVAIAAMKGEADALERYVQLLSDIGKLPSNLDLFRSESEMRRIGEVMVAKIHEFERGEISAVDVAEFFRGLVTARTAAWELSPREVQEIEPGEVT